MFNMLQHALTAFKDRCDTLTDAVHNSLHMWGCLLARLEIRPTHLLNISPLPPSWFGVTDTYGTGMGGVCHDNNRQ